MDLAPARLCARECLDCALQRAVRPRCARHVTQRESVPAGKSVGDQASVPALRTALNDSMKRGVRTLNNVPTSSNAVSGEFNVSPLG